MDAKANWRENGENKKSRGTTKGQGWEQGEKEDRRDKERNRGQGYDDLCVIVSTYCHILSNDFPFAPSVPMIGAERANGKVNGRLTKL